MIETYQNYYKNINKCITPISSKLSISVMTLCGSLGSPINILELFDYYIDIGHDLFDLYYVPNTKKNGQNINKNNAFYNCLNITFYYKDINSIESKIAAKIFPNGSIQIPGCKTIDAVHKTPKIIYNFIKSYSELCKHKYPNIIKEPENFILSNMRIVMINSNFSFNNKINQERIKNIINNLKYDGTDKEEYKWRIATFQPEKYSGVNIRYITKKSRDSLLNKQIPSKLEGQISIFIFRSGKCTITGSKNTNELLEAYKAITDLAFKYKDNIFVE